MPEEREDQPTPPKLIEGQITTFNAPQHEG